MKDVGVPAEGDLASTESSADLRAIEPSGAALVLSKLPNNASTALKIRTNKATAAYRSVRTQEQLATESGMIKLTVFLLKWVKLW